MRIKKMRKKMRNEIMQFYPKFKSLIVRFSSKMTHRFLLNL